MDLTKWRLQKSFLSGPLENQNFYLAFVCQLSFVLVSIIDWNRKIPLQSLFSASQIEVFQNHQYYRLFTAVFAHASWDHVLGNSIFFIPFAAFLANYFGLFIFPFFTFLVGALINLMVIFLYPPEASVVGVSGVVYFMVAFWLVLYIGIERGLKMRQKVIRSFGLALVEFMPEKFDANISYLSHAIGFGMGIFFGLLYFFWCREKFRSKEIWKLLEPVESLELNSDTQN